MREKHSQSILVPFMLLVLTFSCAKKEGDAKINMNKVEPVSKLNLLEIKNPVVLISTSMGDIHIELFQDKAPITVKNFLKYVENKFYSGTLFHRVIPNFMIQGGGIIPGMIKKEGYAPIKNEADNGLTNDRGTLAMARTNIVDSATSQFFINVVDNLFLNHKDKTPRGFGYCVFGRVVDGMDVVDKIKNVETGVVGRYRDVPLENVIIKYTKLIKK